jgi:hypothetical protein
MSLLAEAKKLLALMDEVEVDPRLGDDTDRVFPRYEFDGLRAAVAAVESGGVALRPFLLGFVLFAASGTLYWSWVAAERAAPGHGDRIERLHEIYDDRGPTGRHEALIVRRDGSDYHVDVLEQIGRDQQVGFRFRVASKGDTWFHLPSGELRTREAKDGWDWAGVRPQR